MAGDSQNTGLSPGDPSSFSLPEECLTKHVHIELDVDFETNVLKGNVVLKAETKGTCKTLILDTRDLKIHKVTEAESGRELKYTLHPPVLSFGSKLEIELPNDVKEKISIAVKYETSPKSTALQWLNPEQTADKKHPYLFSQCQAIHARSLLPCQDTPGVKCPFTAKIRAVSGLEVLMSAVKDGREIDEADNSIAVHKFTQKVPVPSYLIAIVAGDLVSKEIGPRSKVWSEPSMVEAAAYEFAETEKMLSTAEDLLGPYVWGVYDLLVLPPSFPYGGMENPCLTFVTPTLLAGDRSLASVVAHEITHSWTGNLVTNKSPEHFWLNEGHTKFVERKIEGRMMGEKFRHFSSMQGIRTLKQTIDLLGADHPYTHLVPVLRDVDPDDAFSSVPYEKGCALLMYLEQQLGGPEVFEPFLRAYIEKFKYQSITSQDWKDFLFEFFKDKLDILNAVDWETWFHAPGMPPVQADYDTEMANACSDLCQKWVKSQEDDLTQFTADDVKNMSSFQVRDFLEQLLGQDTLPEVKVKTMGELYELDATKNSEIKFRWLRLCLKARIQKATDKAIQFVNEQGRLKYVRPLYRDLYGWEDVREKSVKNFQEQRPSMHSLAVTMIGKDLKLED